MCKRNDYLQKKLTTINAIADKCSLTAVNDIITPEEHGISNFFHCSSATTKQPLSFQRSFWVTASLAQTQKPFRHLVEAKVFQFFMALHHFTSFIISFPRQVRNFRKRPNLLNCFMNKIIIILLLYFGKWYIKGLVFLLRQDEFFFNVILRVPMQDRGQNSPYGQIWEFKDRRPS